MVRRLFSWSTDSFHGQQTLFYPSATGRSDWIFIEQLMKRFSLSRKMPGEFIFPKHSNEGKLTSCREWPTRNNFCVLANNYRSLVNAASNNGAAPSTNAASSLMLMLAFVRVHFGESDFWKVCLDDEGSGKKQKVSYLNLQLWLIVTKSCSSQLCLMNY